MKQGQSLVERFRDFRQEKLKEEHMNSTLIAKKENILSKYDKYKNRIEIVLMFASIFLKRIFMFIWSAPDKTTKHSDEQATALIETCTDAIYIKIPFNTFGH